MRKHTLFCSILAFSMALTSLSGLSTTWASAAVNSQTSVSSNQKSKTSTNEQTNSTEQATSLPEQMKEDPEAYCQGNASEIRALQSSSSTEETSQENSLSSITRQSSLKKGSTSVSPFTGATYTHADAFDGMNIYHGIDVSYHQGSIDWAKVKAAGVDFAIIRMGYRGYSAGTLYTDIKFTENMQGAIDAGLKVGVYFFTEAITTDEAVAEAQYVANAISSYNITMPVAIDWESNAAASNGGRKIAAGLTKSQNTIICTAFCDVIKSYGYTPMVYANKSDFTNLLDGAALGEKYEIWLARYNTQAGYDNPYTFWQYSAGSATNKGTVNGITGNVDLNFWYTSGTIDDPTFTHSATGGAVSSPEPDTVDNVKNLSSVSASKSISLTWNKVKNATGYEIYRKDTYNGSYKKVKTITDGNTTSWKNTGLSKKHEYYYKVRAYIKVSDGNIYSGYSQITAATKPSSQVGIAKKSLKLTKTPSKNGKKLITVSTGTPLEYVGQAHLKNGKKFLHVRYITTSKTYDGYLPTNASLKYYPQGTTTALLNLRKTAGIKGKLLASIPKSTPLAIMGSKKVAGITWYKTTFSTKKGKIYTGYVSGSYIKK